MFCPTLLNIFHWTCFNGLLASSRRRPLSLSRTFSVMCNLYRTVSMIYSVSRSTERLLYSNEFFSLFFCLWQSRSSHTHQRLPWQMCYALSNVDEVCTLMVCHNILFSWVTCWVITTINKSSTDYLITGARAEFYYVFTHVSGKLRKSSLDVPGFNRLMNIVRIFFLLKFS